MTATELVQKIRADRPDLRLAIGGESGDTALAAWKDGQWIMFAGLMLTGDWASIGNLIIDGKPVVSNWREV